MLWTWFIFSIICGSCVGSFLNVVIYRVPEGKSIVTPPSTCPKCGYRLAWYDNIPILAWFFLRGKCRKCNEPISFQYPLIEAITAAVFGLWFIVCYFTHLRPDFSGPGFEATFPIFIVFLVLFSALLASTMIDARYFIIPLPITWLVVVVAIIILPLATVFSPAVVTTIPQSISLASLVDNQLAQYANAAVVELTQQRGGPWPVYVTALPLVGSYGITVAAGASLGLIISLLLLHLKILPRSFNETLDDTDNDPEHFLAHPHPRREVCKECLFLTLPIASALAACYIPQPTNWTYPLWLHVLSGIVLGYLVGGLTVWLIRIMGTFAFGKEAMGLGDVHLMAAVGAVCGWQIAILAFFIAPFFGLSWAVLSIGAQRLLKRQVKAIPYGPHLAIATFVACIFREPLMTKFGILFML